MSGEAVFQVLAACRLQGVRASGVAACRGAEAGGGRRKENGQQVRYLEVKQYTRTFDVWWLTSPFS